MPITPTPLTVEIGRRIKQRRKALGLSAKEVGQKAGLSFQSVFNYEQGKHEPAFVQLVRFSRALDVPVAELISGLDCFISDRTPR